MSYQLLKEDVLFYQRFLKSNGLYTKKLDGIWGSKTDEADQKFIAEGERIATNLGRFDPRSESNIITLIPKAQVMARTFLNKMVAAGKDVRIISGTRTYAEQNALYRIGRFGNPGAIVTKAKGGQSNHNFGVAWDIGLFENGNYITTDKPYKDIAQMVTDIQGLEWGGNWTSFKDFPHYQIKTISSTVAGVRLLFEEGKQYV